MYGGYTAFMSFGVEDNQLQAQEVVWTSRQSTAMRRRQSTEVYSFCTPTGYAAYIFLGQAQSLMVHSCTAQYPEAAVSSGNTYAQQTKLDPTVPSSECKAKL